MKNDVCCWNPGVLIVQVRSPGDVLVSYLDGVHCIP